MTSTASRWVAGSSGRGGGLGGAPAQAWCARAQCFVTVLTLTLTLTLALTVMLTAEGPMLTVNAHGQCARSTALRHQRMLHGAWSKKFGSVQAPGSKKQKEWAV
jgi:hypothetical protein